MKQLFICILIIAPFFASAQSKNEITVAGGIKFVQGSIFSIQYEHFINQKQRSAIGIGVDHLRLATRHNILGSYKPIGLFFTPAYEYFISKKKISWGIGGGIAIGYSDYIKTKGLRVSSDFAVGITLQTNISYQLNELCAIKLGVKEYVLNSNHLDVSNTFAFAGIGFKF